MNYPTRRPGCPVPVPVPVPDGEAASAMRHLPWTHTTPNREREREREREGKYESGRRDGRLSAGPSQFGGYTPGCIPNPPSTGGTSVTAYRWLLGSLVLVCASALSADGPGDNVPDKVRPVPPEGVKIADGDRQELQSGVEALGKEIADLRKALEKKPALLELLPDVQIFHNAVRYALTYNEFYDLKEVDTARKQLEQGMERAKALREGKSPWTAQTGYVLRGYVSKIDGSVQPYGLTVPAAFNPSEPGRYRLDVWCHGRGEKLTELAFLNQKGRYPGEAPHTFVLYLYG